MQGDYILALTLIFSLLFFVLQRTEAKYRKVLAIIMLITGGYIIREFVIWREIESEAYLSLAIAFFLNLGFWLFVGRYNPVGSSDQIQVLGMDD